MALKQKLDLRQSQTLVITPQLQQAIKLLQMSTLELSAYVEQELEKNPLLEMAETEGADDAADGAAEDSEASGFEDGDSPDSLDLTTGDAMAVDDAQPLDADYQNVYQDDSPDGGTASDWGSTGNGSSGGSGGFEDEERDPFARLSEAPDLRSHLEQQVALDIPDPHERAIALALLAQLDEAGYIACALEEVAAALGCPLEDVERVLAIMQRFDPAGICARDLRECLALQLRDRNRFDPAMEALIDNLELLANHRLPDLLKRCGVDAEDLAEMIAELRRLDPKPASRFQHMVAQTIVPDVFIRPTPQGGWRVELNPDTLPRLLVNRRYYATVAKRARGKQDKEYLTTQLSAASWLVRSLDQRANTILKVSTDIVRQQEAFLRQGISALKPMTLRDIASAIGMHESTVSRVTSNKYMVTPRGTFELKFFFTSALGGGVDGDDAHSSEAVRHRIRSLIEAESPNAVLSDDKLVDILQREGIDVARRTVAKYREGMGIGSSVQRRRQKKLAQA